MVKKLISVILAAAIVFTACSAAVVSASEKEISEPLNFEDYTLMLNQAGYGKNNKTSNASHLFPGYLKPEKFNFVVDDMVGEICNYIKTESSLDILGIVTNFPKTSGGLELIYETFDVNVAEIRNVFLQLRADMDEQGNYTAAALFHFMAVYFGIIEECKAFCVQTENENIYEIHLSITLKDGSCETVGTGVMINTETKQAYGKDGNGILNTGYSFSISELLLYSNINIWVRNFGFCFFYDLFSYATPFFFYETRRIKFDCNGLEWMIQLWKGNYLITNGAEVGIYSRDESRFGTYYDCATDEQMMPMSMELYHGDELIFSREKQLHWWLTGFRITDNLYPSNSMTLRFSIDMPSEKMLRAFCNAIDNHYMHDISYTVNGMTVNVVW